MKKQYMSIWVNSQSLWPWTQNQDNLIKRRKKKHEVQFSINQMLKDRIETNQFKKGQKKKANLH